MSPITEELHRSLLRAVKAAIAAWERWLDAKRKERKKKDE